MVTMVAKICCNFPNCSAGRPPMWNSFDPWVMSTVAVNNGTVTEKACVATQANLPFQA